MYTAHSGLNMSTHLNIAFYTDTFYPAVDGVVTSVSNFSHELKRRGHNVYIFTAGKKTKDNAATVDVFFERGIRFKKYPQYTLAMFPFVSSIKVRKFDIDIVHTHTPFFMGMSAMMIAKINKLPLVGSFHTLFTDKAVIDEYAAKNALLQKVANRYSWPYARFFYNRCDRVIAPSASTAGILSGEGINNISVVENGIDLRRFNSKVNGKRLRNRLLTDGYEHIVLYLGRVSKEKRIDTMIKAARRIKRKDVRFVIAGTGPALDHYKRLAAHYRLDGKVVFTGFVNGKDLPEYYAASDMLCMPSTFETQGIVTLEAMACNKPVVGADYMALKDLVVDGFNGEKFAPNSSVDCARKIMKVLGNEGGYEGMLATARKYSIEKTTDKLLNVYKEAIH